MKWQESVRCACAKISQRIRRDKNSTASGRSLSNDSKRGRGLRSDEVVRTSEFDKSDLVLCSLNIAGEESDNFQPIGLLESNLQSTCVSKSFEFGKVEMDGEKVYFDNSAYVHDCTDCKEFEGNCQRDVVSSSGDYVYSTECFEKPFVYDDGDAAPGKMVCVEFCTVSHAS